MLFKTWGNKEGKTVVLLHGGGLSWWSNQETIAFLKKYYYVVAVVIDGHGEEAEKTFGGIENAAEQLIDYIHKELHGTVYAMIGLSLGAQIIVETLSQKNDIADYAVIESALVYPLPFMGTIAPVIIKSSYGLIRKR